MTQDIEKEIARKRKKLPVKVDKKKCYDKKESNDNDNDNELGESITYQ